VKSQTHQEAELEAPLPVCSAENICLLDCG